MNLPRAPSARYGTFCSSSSRESSKYTTHTQHAHKRFVLFEALRFRSALTDNPPQKLGPAQVGNEGPRAAIVLLPIVWASFVLCVIWMTLVNQRVARDTFNLRMDYITQVTADAVRGFRLGGRRKN